MFVVISVADVLTRARLFAPVLIVSIVAIGRWLGIYLKGDKP